MRHTGLLCSCGRSARVPEPAHSRSMQGFCVCDLLSHHPGSRRLTQAPAVGYSRRTLHRPIAAVASSTLVGIDLGTSNSAISVVKHGRVQILPDEQGSCVTPSLVSYTQVRRRTAVRSLTTLLLQGLVSVRASGIRHLAVRTASMNTHPLAMQDAVTVGAAAHGSDAANTFYSVKRLIGRSLAEVAADVAGLRYEVCAAGRAGEVSPATADSSNETSSSRLPERDGDACEADGGVRLRCLARGALLRPEEVSAELLRHLLARARAHLGPPITNAASARRCQSCVTSTGPWDSPSDPIDTSAAQRLTWPASSW